MAETKKVTSIYVVTDTETGQEKIGDIDGGGMDEIWLKEHIRKYGSEGLVSVAAWISFQAIKMQRQINEEINDCVAAS